MNLILNTDSYKLAHWNQYPPKTQQIYSYLSARYGRYKYSVFFGLQYIIKKHLSKPISQKDIDEAYRVSKDHFGCKDVFNLKGWQYILDHYDGYLPIAIYAYPEGSIIPIGTPLMAIENTDPKCFWLTNYIESLLLQIWYPITIATMSHVIKQDIEKSIAETGEGNADFKLHNFGLRGSSSLESAAIGGAAHLTSFLGSDDLPAIQFINEYYHTESMPCFSIPATEHSTMTSWGKENEAKAYLNMLNNYKNSDSIKAFSVVSDSYDIENACENIWGDLLKEDVENSKATLVIRPDSGDPVDSILSLLSILSERFGCVKNEKGYNVLNKVRLIQGDGIDEIRITEILNSMKQEKWSTDNITFGMGGGLMQQIDRDTQGFAIKCSWAMIDGEPRDVFKKPSTDLLKASKVGRFDNLPMVYYNGALFRDINFDTIRTRIRIQTEGILEN